MADSTLHAMTQNTDPQPADEFYLLDDPGGTPADNRISHFNVLNVNNLTEDTAPANASDFGLMYDTSASGARKVLARRFGSYHIPSGFFTSLNPADATTYYWGSFPSTAANTAAAGRRIYLPYPGILTAVDVLFACTAGSNQTSTLSIRKNNTTDTTVTSAIDLSSTPYHELVTGLSIDLTTAGDYFEFKWVTPTWTTNPTGVFCQVRALIAMSG